MNSTMIAIENAIASGEIKLFGMTSDEALTALKKSKDKRHKQSGVASFTHKT